MKNIIHSLLLIVLGLSPLTGFAQIPNCAGADSTKLFVHQGSNIMVFDPAFPLSPTNPSLFLAAGIPMGGLAISYNLNGGVASPTFYTNSGGTYSWYNGAGWTNTGHAITTVNPGGGVNFIYSKDGFNGNIYKYDGLGAATFLTTVSGNAGPFDLAVDNQDNFYHLVTNITPGMIIKYNPAGAPIDTFVVNGNPIQTAGGGFAMIGDWVFAVFNSTPSFYSGQIIGGICNLTPLGNMSASDLASCPLKPVTTIPPTPPVADFVISNYTICAGACVTFADSSTNGPTTWSWNFPSGTPATSILQNPGSVCFNTPGVYTIELIVSNLGGADTATKVLTVLPVPVATISASDTELCEGESSLLTAGPAGANFLWSTGATQQTILVTPATNTTYTLVSSLDICSDTTTQDITVWPFAVGTISDDTLVCNGEPVQLWVTGGTGQYQWYPANTLSCEFCPDPVAVALGTTTYYAVLLDPHGCQDTLSVTIENHPPFNLVLHNSDTTIYLGDNVQLLASGAPYYYWTPTDYLTYSQSNNPLSTPYEDITYTVTGVSLLQGCPQKKSVTIRVIPKEIIIPNAFTPNGDGNNDVFRVVAGKFVNVQEFKIYNRWGTEIFSTQDISKGWDGTYKGIAQDPGVYYYMVRVAHPSGKTQMFKGDVTLVR